MCVYVVVCVWLCVCVRPEFELIRRLQFLSVCRSVQVDHQQFDLWVFLSRLQVLNRDMLYKK